MKLLLDESLPRQLKKEFSEYEVMTVPERGWQSKKNGRLLTLASGEFDVFLTRDRRMKDQQNLKSFNIAIMVLIAYTNDIEDLVPLVPQIKEILQTIQPKDYVEVSIESE